MFWQIAFEGQKRGSQIKINIRTKQYKEATTGERPKGYYLQMFHAFKAPSWHLSFIRPSYSILKNAG